ncbi:MAG: response regulator transcription factor [Thermodesulfovibrionales bacterium]
MTAGQKELVLVVEDEKKISEIVMAYLSKEGFGVRLAETGGDALRLMKEQPSLVILDLMLPDIPGEDVCRSIREHSNVPVIMLTAKSGEEDRIAGLGIGADDYVVKPFSPRELVARVKAQLRRSGRSRNRRLSYNGGRLVISPGDLGVVREGASLALTPTEFKILLYLAENAGRILSRNQIVNSVQGYDFEGFDRTIDAHVKNLRHKVEKDSKKPEFIQTVYGVGYKFIGSPDEE